MAIPRIRKPVATVWAIVTKMMDGWKLLSVSVDTADSLMDLFKDRQTQFGLDPLLTVPTTGSGNIAPIPRTIASID